jgi:hypothetical protein
MVPNEEAPRGRLLDEEAPAGWRRSPLVGKSLAMGEVEGRLLVR